MTSDDEKGFYNYFGNYRRNEQIPFNQPAQFSFGYPPSFSNNNEDFINHAPGLGLFQTKRSTSRYSGYDYFPPSQMNREKYINSPKKKMSLNKPAFYTGSEDESGVISESSMSSKPFQNRFEVDEERITTKPSVNRENNPYSFAHLFFPNMDHVSPIGHKVPAKSHFFEKEEENFGGFDEKKLNDLFSGGVRFRNLQGGQEIEDMESSELPPGLH